MRGATGWVDCGSSHFIQFNVQKYVFHPKVVALQLLIFQFWASMQIFYYSNSNRNRGPFCSSLEKSICVCFDFITTFDTIKFRTMMEYRKDMVSDALFLTNFDFFSNRQHTLPFNGVCAQRFKNSFH